MDVSGVGAAPTGVELSTPPRGLGGPKGHDSASKNGLAQSADSISEGLSQLSKPEIARFLEIIDRPPRPEMAAQLDGLLRASESAAAEGNVPQALVKLIEFARLDPRRAESLASEPGLAPIRGEVQRLLDRLSSTAKLEAELRLGQATHFLEEGGARNYKDHQIRPETIVLVAGRLLEAGGYANYIRSAELSQIPINQYGGTPTPPPLDSGLTRKGITGKGLTRSARASLARRNAWRLGIEALCKRAPLLVLLLAWLTVGVVGGAVSALVRNFRPAIWPDSLVETGFEIWGLGFLVLILIGFYARVRDLLW